ncbi:zinc-dependent metalloprotease [Cytophagaceae bacterium DM2B3-1]|uniref:Zinc-dependent metalloprotease n=1 Tax=Xanthocytophaga flava TaxID=3048013 RepID=A0ABT7CHV7_9BACT|nr:zinc-dependent metalloprotease [Xanthocytophaga flavus]MDJ1468435.1 zinc-dependent metalloprotease [Xanthocytophaga flavus]MDJ1493320.1 zinc-dependent metalloprotease [Xanthocytophaga flavus]
MSFTKVKVYSFFLLCTILWIQPAAGQKKKKQKEASTTPPSVSVTERKTGPKAYKDVITGKAQTSKGLFTVHKVDDKYYFEIPDSLFNRDFMTITRISKTATDLGYGGEQANRQVLRWEKGPENKIFLRVPLFINVSTDTIQPISQAVKNSNMDPLAAAFDIRAIRKDTSVVIDVTDFFKMDNQIFSLTPMAKQMYKITALQTDRSYIESIRSFPINTEVRTIKTFGVTPPTPSMGPSPSPIPSVNLPGGSAAGVITLELNTSMILLPKVPMKKRLFDPRVGFFANGYTVYDDASQRTDRQTFAVRWRLEAKNAADIEKQKQGQLIEPKKPIIFYIDPATPTKWRKYLKQGVEDWQAAFEKAGWKNAILAKDFPAGDTASLEDARYSVIRYFASGIENAYGPNVHDPRSGEIIESHIGWYHNVMNLLRKWYMIQGAAVDARARKPKFDDELMGELIRFVSSHEVGHTLGLRHNFGASSATPVEKLRDKAFIAKNGHTSSIMDYARFNYVAQPEDGITDLFPRIGDYDMWAIEWGYKPIYETKTEEEDKVALNKLYKDKAEKNRRLYFLTETNAYDPRAQSEDLSDNSMTASDYGIKNLKRIVPNLVNWTKEEAETYESLTEIYNEVVGQYRRYIGHVTKNVGGIYETPKTFDQEGVVYETTPKAIQKQAVTWLNKQVFETPTWLLDPQVLSRIRPDQGVEALRVIHETTINNLFDNNRLQRLIETSVSNTNAYALDELFTDVQKGIWSELASRKPIDNFRRNLQKIYVEKMNAIINPPSGPSMAGMSFSFPNTVASPTPDVRKSDIISMARGSLTELRTQIKAAIPGTTDKMSRYHLQDVLTRIDRALDPK